MKLSLTQEEVEKIVLDHVNLLLLNSLPYRFDTITLQSSYSYSAPFCMVSKAEKKEEPQA